MLCSCGSKFGCGFLGDLLWMLSEHIDYHKAVFYLLQDKAEMCLADVKNVSENSGRKFGNFVFIKENR